MHQKNVLVVSYFYPPINSIGAIRVGKFVKYLSEYGWRSTVLTVDLPQVDTIGQNDLSLGLLRAPMPRYFERLISHRARIRAAVTSSESESASGVRWSERLWRRVSGSFTDSRFPDRALPWYLPALLLGVEKLAAERFDLVFSSHGPPGSTIVASLLAKHYGIPWVADFRDLWSKNHAHQRSSRIWQFGEEALERLVLSHAASLTTVSLPLAQELEQLHHKTVHIIGNGFDPTDYVGIQPIGRERHILRLIYTGTLYRESQDIEPLFDALASLYHSGEISSAQVCVEFWGSDATYIRSVAERKGIQSMIHVKPRISHSECTARQVGSDLLLLLDWKDPTKGFVSGKIFEYLGARRPILAMGPKGGIIPRILEETKAGVFLMKAIEIERYLVEVLREQRAFGAVKYAGCENSIREYTRQRRARDLAVVFDNAASAQYAYVC